MIVSNEMLIEAEQFCEEIMDCSKEAVDYRSECVRFGCGMGYD